MARRKALGKGLKALIPETPRARAGLLEIPLDRIVANPAQPRTRFDEGALAELASSIREHGVLQPLLVHEHEGVFVLVAGERRWRAARIAGLTAVPAVVRELVADDDDLQLALVENLQRRDLTPLEEARAFELLRTKSGLSQAQIADRVGIDRSTVANALRLLKLSPEIQAMVEEGRLSAGHARALLSFTKAEERQRWAERAAATGLSVRELESAAAERRGTPGKGRRRPRERDPNLAAAAERLSLRLGARADIRPRRRGGVISIACPDHEELMRVFDLLMGE
jgi:ParB family transcriptional regulator, chromosome partitioning protein